MNFYNIKKRPLRFAIILLLFTPLVILARDEYNGNTISGKLTVDTVLDTASGPWTVVGNVTIPANVTLTIEPGVIVYFKSGKRIIVETKGCIHAVGNEENLILMTREQGTNTHWGGIYFNLTMEDNQLCYVNMYYADYDYQSVLLNNSKLLIYHMEWNNKDTKIFEINHPSLIIQNSTFPDLSNSECIRVHIPVNLATHSG